MPEQLPLLRVGIIEDDPQYADNLSLLLSRSAGLEIAFISASVEEALALHGVELAGCSCLLLDINLEGQDGISGIPLLKKQLPPDSQIIMLSLHEGADTIRDAFRMGASGYLIKADPLHLLQEFITSSLRLNAPAMSRPVFQVFLQDSLRCSANPPAPCLDGFTYREQEIYGLLLKGWDNKKIASMLHISGATVNFHLKNIFLKRNVHTRAELLSKHLEEIQQAI